MVTHFLIRCFLLETTESLIGILTSGVGSVPQPHLSSSHSTYRCIFMLVVGTPSACRASYQHLQRLLCIFLGSG